MGSKVLPGGVVRNLPGDVKLPQGLFDIYGNIRCFGYETIDVK